jgi:drug/metabolite transporter (DMT)-like permease
MTQRSETARVSTPATAVSTVRAPVAGWVGTAALGVTVVTWASAFPAIRVGLEGLSPWALGLLRLLVASAALGVVALVVGAPVPPRALWPRVALAGLLGQTLYQGLLMMGEVRVPAGTASILIATAPLFSVAGAALLLGESARGRWQGMVVAFLGTVLVGTSLGVGGGPAALLVLGAAACQGTYHVVVKPLAQRIGPFAATAWSVWAGTLLALPAAPLLASDLRTAAAPALAAAVFLGVVPSALGYLAWSVAVARTSIARSTAGLYLVPVVAILLAWWWLGERPSPLAVAGGVLAVLGVVLVRRSAASRA